MDLRGELIQLAKSLNIDDLGFVDVRLYRRVNNGHVPKELLPNVKVAIVYITLLDKILDKYGHWYIVSLINHLSKTNERIVNFLRKRGYDADGIIDEYHRDTLSGKISFRQLAVLAGLGGIGKNSMLIHPKFGPRVVIGVVLTNADVAPNKPITRNFCRKCEICVKACPVNAIGDKFDPWKCKNRRKILKKGCKIRCITLCPVGA